MTSPLPLVERKQRQARQRIVRAAEELFHARGFDAVSVSDIAAAAEVGRTTFFRHFGDKQEVVFAREQELLEAITGTDRQDDATPPRTTAEAVTALRPLVVEICGRISTDPDAYTRHYRLIARHPELRARDTLKTQQFAAMLGARLIRSGAPEPTAILAAELALACVRTARHLAEHDPATLVDEVQEAFDRVLALGADAP